MYEIKSKSNQIKWFMNKFLKSKCDLKLKSVTFINAYADLYWLLQFLLMIHKELFKDCSIHDEVHSEKSSFWMNRDLSDDLWRTEVTNNNNLCSEAFWLNQKSYSENWLFELCKRWSIVSIWRWRNSAFSDLL